MSRRSSAKKEEKLIIVGKEQRKTNESGKERLCQHKRISVNGKQTGIKCRQVTNLNGYVTLSDPGYATLVMTSHCYLHAILSMKNVPGT